MKDKDFNYTRTIKFKAKRLDSDEWRTSRKLIEPIKLTPQILEDNGWVKEELKKEDNAHAYYYTI